MRSQQDFAQLKQQFHVPVLACERVAPVPGPLETFFPSGGMPRGWRLRCSGQGCRAIGTILLSHFSQSGDWVAVVGLPLFGWSAAFAAGCRPERSVDIAVPDTGIWGQVMGAAIDVADVVVFDAAHGSPQDQRRLDARAREREVILMELETDRQGSTPCDLHIQTATCRWEGVEQGYGRLTHRTYRISVSGRGVRPRDEQLILVGSQGEIEASIGSAREIAAYG